MTKKLLTFYLFSKFFLSFCVGQNLQNKLITISDCSYYVYAFAL